MAGSVQGKSYTWQLSDAPIGSGDAGEVFAAVCIEQPELSGVIKKPARIATSGTIQRQAGQIAQEGLALAHLRGLPRCKAHPPLLLDTAPDYTHGTANYFIVSGSAPGSDMASMLAESRHTGKPFPRRVIISVLDALFDLFARAHRAGVLWNDVKLDHIYWYNPTSEVAVIDWGNAVFLDEKIGRHQRALPRWEDYRQLVETLGEFLLQAAPELFTDLGWNEFQGEALDSPRVSILARRIAYQQQVIALRVMEFQSLIRVVLSSDPSLEGLQRIQTYHNALEQIGAAWDDDAVLDYSRTLVLGFLAEKEVQSGVRAATLVWDIFDTALDLPWHLLREYFRNPDLISHPLLPDLVNHTLHEHWSMALWTLIVIAQEAQPADWWDRLAPVLRQKAIGAVTPPPYQTSQSLLTWVEAQGVAWEDRADQLRSSLQNWRSKGKDLEESPFDYAVLDLIRSEQGIPIPIRSQFKQSFAAGEEAIRELLQVWVNINWDALPQAFRRVAGWDPDRWGIVRLAQAVEDFQSWLEDLYNGPMSGAPVERFIQTMIQKRPPVDQLLGTPPWLNSLLRMLDAVQQGSPISRHRAKVQLWCPWLLRFPDIHTPERRPAPADEATTHEVLSHFVKHLKTWSDIEAGLHAVRTSTPEYFPICRELVEGFQRVFSLNLNDLELEQGGIDVRHPVLKECQEMLDELLIWRKHIDRDDLEAAASYLRDSQDKGWLILIHTRERSEAWAEEIAPILQSLANHETYDHEFESSSDISSLIAISNSFTELHEAWSKIYDSGLHQRLLETLEDSIEEMRNDFFTWRQSMEHSVDRLESLLYHSQMKHIRRISAKLLILSEQIHQTRLNFISLGEKNEVALPAQMRNAQNVLYHLSKIEAFLVPESKRRFPDWIQAFQTITEAESPQVQHELVIALPEEHPLFTWLVQSILV